MATDTAQRSGSLAGITISNIGSELLIIGNVKSDGQIHLDGQVQGEIQCASLVLGKHAQLEGSAIAEEVVVAGRLVGTVRAVRLKLQASCHVEGDILCQSLEIQQGAYFDGHSRRAEDSLSLQHGRSVAQRALQSNEKPKIIMAAGFHEDRGRGLPELHSSRATVMRR